MNSIHILAQLAGPAEAQDVTVAGPILIAAAIALPLLGIAAAFVEALLPARGFRS